MVQGNSLRRGSGVKRFPNFFDSEAPCPRTIWGGWCRVELSLEVVAFTLPGARLAGTHASHRSDSSPALPHAGFRKGHYGMVVSR